MQYINQSSLFLGSLKQLSQALSHALHEGLEHILTCARTDSADSVLATCISLFWQVRGHFFLHRKNTVQQKSSGCVFIKGKFP